MCIQSMILDWTLLASEPDPWAIGWSTIASAAALVGVGVAIFVATRDTRRLIRVSQQDASDRKRDQAVRVSAWATSESDFPDSPKQNVVGNPWYAVVHVLNNSSAAISNVRVEIGHRGVDGRWQSLSRTHEWIIIAPGKEERCEFNQRDVRMFAEPPHNVLMCTLTFRDNNNCEWQRDASNVLSEVTGAKGAADREK
jgi:hypothetical protein